MRLEGRRGGGSSECTDCYQPKVRRKLARRRKAAMLDLAEWTSNKSRGSLMSVRPSHVVLCSGVTIIQLEWTLFNDRCSLIPYDAFISHKEKACYFFMLSNDEVIKSHTGI
jgi:hypothetical protein